jgi:CHRD domain
MRLRWPALAAAVFTALALVIPSVASAARRPLFAAMNGQNEIANGDRGAGDRDGGGSFSAVIEGRELCYGLTVRDIEDPVQAHIHRGGPNTNGPIVVPLTSLPVSGDPGSSAGCRTLSRRLVRQIRGNPGGFYVNVHTADFQAGAIRGQLFSRGGP